MESSALKDERRKEDLELLALFDSDCTQNLVAYANASGLYTPNSSAGFEFPALTDNGDEDNWMMDLNLDAETLAYLDDIIAADEASRATSTATPSATPSTTPSATPSAKPACSQTDSTFTMPRRLKCPMCPKEFYCNAALRRHGSRHILKLIRCPCGFRGRSLVQTEKHYGYHHSGMLKHKFLASF